MFYKDVNNKLFQEPSEEVIEANDLIQITEDEFNTILEENKLIAFNALTYKDKRAMEYPSMATQLDMQYWDMVNGTTVWKDTIEAIKNKYPKPE